MKVGFRCGFSTHMFVLYWYLQFFCSWLAQPPFRSKVFFFICSPGSFQVTWSFPTLWSSWHGCPNCFATRNPKHMTLVFQQCHLQVCLWREETEAMPCQDFATNGRHIVCQRPLPQVSSWVSLSLRTDFCCVSETWNFSTCGACWEHHFGQLFAPSEWSWVLQPLKAEHQEPFRSSKNMLKA